MVTISAHMGSGGLRLGAAAAVIAAACWAAPAHAAGGPAAPERCQSASASGHSGATARALFCIINAERRRQGLKPLRRSVRLARAAHDHAADMVARGFFAHVNPDGVTPFARIKAQRVRYKLAGENLYWGTAEHGRWSAEEAMLAFWNSTTHRRNVLEPKFRWIGVAVVAGAPVSAFGDPAATFTLTFAG